MTEKTIREKIAAAKEKTPEWMNDENIRCRYGGAFPRKRSPNEVSPKVEVEVTDSTEEITRLIKKAANRGRG